MTLQSNKATYGSLADYSRLSRMYHTHTAGLFIYLFIVRIFLGGSSWVYGATLPLWR